MSDAQRDGWVLVLDTCGEQGTLALCRGRGVVAEAVLAERAASASLLAAMRELLASQGVTVRELAAIGVVRGPGSFTGVRVGLAFAKGLCEATGCRLAAVSRLEVLAEAAEEPNSVAVLEAGRGQVYMRADGREWLLKVEDLRALVVGKVVAVSTEALAEAVGGSASRVVQLQPAARDAVAAVWRCLEAGGSELAGTDANYVRNEEAIYAAKSQAGQVTPAERREHERQ